MAPLDSHHLRLAEVPIWDERFYGGVYEIEATPLKRSATGNEWLFLASRVNECTLVPSANVLCMVMESDFIANETERALTIGLSMDLSLRVVSWDAATNDARSLPCSWQLALRAREPIPPASATYL